MKVLIVEDEPRMGQCLRQGLAEAGFVADLAQDGVEGEQLAITGDYDLIVLDIMLPGLDGWHVLEAIRRAGKSTPVIFITACEELENRERALAQGANDYLVKPFSFVVLLAKMRALMRRVSTEGTEVLRAGDLRVDLSLHKVTRSEKRIDLTGKEFALLELLLRRQGEVVPHSLIASEVWDIKFEGDIKVIEAAMHRLQMKVDGSFEPKLIRSIRGMGSVLAGPNRSSPDVAGNS